MTLKEHIEDIHEGLKTNRYPDEAAVSQGIVLRLLGTLGWSTYDTQVVFPQYGIEGRKVDFALCYPASKPIVFIEVKRVGNIEGAERQLFEYAFHEGIPIAILTDGQTWRFFYPIGEGNYRERKVHEMDLTKGDSEEHAKWLNRYLNYESIRTGAAVEAIKEDYEKVVQQRQVATRLPEAWSKLVAEADEFLLDVVAKKVESLCRYKPTDEQVLGFLRNLEQRTEPVPPNPVPTPKPTPMPTPTEEITVWEAVQKATNGNRNVRFTIKEIEQTVSKEHHDFKTGNVRKWIRASAVDFPTRDKYPKRPDRYRWKGKDRYYLL